MPKLIVDILAFALGVLGTVTLKLFPTKFDFHKIFKIREFFYLTSELFLIYKEKMFTIKKDGREAP